MALGFEAAIVLFVAFFQGITGIKAADAFKKASSRFAKLIGKSKAQVHPFGIRAGDIGEGRLDTGNNGIDIETDVGRRTEALFIRFGGKD